MQPSEKGPRCATILVPRRRDEILGLILPRTDAQQIKGRCGRLLQPSSGLRPHCRSGCGIHRARQQASRWSDRAQQPSLGGVNPPQRRPILGVVCNNWHGKIYFFQILSVNL